MRKQFLELSVNWDRAGGMLASLTGTDPKVAEPDSAQSYELVDDTPTEAVAGVEGAPMPLSDLEALAAVSPVAIRDAGVEELSHELLELPSPDPSLLVATAKEVYVYSKADIKSSKLGYLRAGAQVKRSPEEIKGTGCNGSWYSIAPHGFVCRNSGVSLDQSHVLSSVLARRPDRGAGMPYAYAKSVKAAMPLYTRIPSVEEQRQVEQRTSGKASKGWGLDASYPVPDFLRDHKPSLYLSGRRRSADQLVLRTAPLRTSFSLIDWFEEEHRAFGLTTELEVIPLDRTEPIEPSHFRGIHLSQGLPAAFVRRRGLQLYTGTPGTTEFKSERVIEFREGFELTGEKKSAGGLTFLQTIDEHWLPDDANLVKINARKEFPHYAKQGAEWIDVSLKTQFLVAYRGMTPVYATLVSTGVGADGDPEKTHATLQGEFRIHTKHVTTTMASDDPEDNYELRDIPYVQYFKDGYAFHAAYWHDGFGTPRSHGCINLAPDDARWLFSWSEPAVPEQWHGTMSFARGTRVLIRP